MGHTDFSSVTEVTGYKVTKEQIQRIYNRYCFATGFCKDKKVLEVACGTGQGLGLLARTAKKVVGGDIDKKLLEIAKAHYRDRHNIQFQRLDAHRLPFLTDSFDVVIFYEAIYYLSEPQKFILEAHRVLKKGGVLIVCSANKDCEGFNRSPYSYYYFSAQELFDLFQGNGFVNIELFGDCPVEIKTTKDRILAFLKKKAVAWHLIPKTMKGKELFKRFFYGELLSLPPELEDGIAYYSAPVSLPVNNSQNAYKVLFGVGFK